MTRAPVLAVLALLAVFTLAAACKNETQPAKSDPDRDSTGGSADTSASADSEAPSAETSASDSEGSESSSAGQDEGGPDSVADKPSAGGAAPPGGKAPEQVKGASQTTDAYGAWLQSSGRYVAGKPATVQAVLVAKGGFKCNEKYPYKFKLNAPPAGVTYPNKTVRGIQYGKQRSVMSIPFSPSKPGDVTISGTFYVSVCDAERCKIGKQPLSVTVTVESS